MEFDFSKLLGRIVEKYGTQSAFAKAWGKQDSYVSMRLNNKTKFDLQDIYEIVELLDLSAADIPVYFFTPKVR